MKISTGEIIKIAEVDLNRLNDEYKPLIIINHLHLPVISRSILEEAKLGYDTNFKNHLGVPPDITISHLTDKSCYDKYTCASHDNLICKMTPKPKRERKAFPVCWVVNAENKMVREVVTSLIFKLREGFRIFIVV